VGYTITEKILMAHCQDSQIKSGDIIEVSCDRVFTHDVFGPFVVENFKKIKTSKVWDNDKIVFIVDHEIPPVSEEVGACYKKILDFAKEQDIKRFHYGDGVCHQLMPEQGYVKPGDIVFGTDSHTVTYGALGCFSTGIGTTEMAALWAKGKIWLRVPETIKINLNGKLPHGVYSKDIILYLIGKLTSDGATYKTIEFQGDCISSLSMDARMTITNMAVELGAKNGIMPADDITKEYIKKTGVLDDSNFYYSDADAVYCEVLDIDVSTMVPYVSGWNGIDDVKPLSQVEGLTIHEAFLGSCTNGRLEDLIIAAEIVKNKKVHRNVRFVVTPASRTIYKDALKLGVLEILSDAGAIITNPYCGLCYGKSGGVLGENEVAICSNNRNFPGRLGHKTSKVYLASPASVAASALEGTITDARKYL
jgi:3-isopropylmalate/(R)-2-methylmalate dehydratase large subunit